MNRRDTVLALLALAGIAPSINVSAQTPQKVRRIGLLDPYGAAYAPFWDEFRQGLQEVGQTQGQHYVLVERSADGKNERLAGLAAELVLLNVDVIVASSTNAVLAAQRATKTIPIVFVQVSDPVAAGFAESLARPGRNMTGISNFSGDLVPKRLELLKLAMPKLSRVAALVNPNNPYFQAALSRTRAAADAIGVQLAVALWNGAADIDTVIAKIARDRTQALVITADAYYVAHIKEIADATIKHRISSIAAYREYAEAGGLMSYGTQEKAQLRRVAGYVDKILRGAKPENLPIEQPATFELVLNVKTARALGITFPTELRLRADQVIE